jgi:hypothetical protein
MVAWMFALRVLTGSPTLPELFEDRVLALVPATLFSFVLDRLQFVAKPLLLVSLAVITVPLGALFGWFFGKTLAGRPLHDPVAVVGGIAYGLILWLVLEAAVAVWGEGLTAAITSAGLLLASAEAFGISLVLLSRLLDLDPGVGPADVRRRTVVFGGLSTAATRAGWWRAGAQVLLHSRGVLDFGCIPTGNGGSRHQI